MEIQIQLQKDVPLNKYCTYRTGGPARFFAPVTRWEEMLAVREFARKNRLPFLMLGGGSNVLFADEGFPGVVVQNRMGQIHIQNEVVTAEGGVNLMKLLLLCAENNLGGLGGLANVPGTVGGAVYGNAGIPDLWIGDVLVSALILPEGGQQPVEVKPEYFNFSYRTSTLKRTKDIVLAATLRFKSVPKAAARFEIEQYIKNRALKQPAGSSCGSFFKNPGAFPSAGWLIEQAGCKGLTVGGAQVSPKHANFLMNTGAATTADILNLAKEVHRRVKAKFDVSMEPEVQIYAQTQSQFA